VTWADGQMVQGDSEEEEEEGEGGEFELGEEGSPGGAPCLHPAQGGGGPAVVVVLPSPADARLFAGLDEGALLQQKAPASEDAGPLGREALLERRQQQALQLQAAYEREVWALADELLLRRIDMAATQPGAQVMRDPAAPAAPAAPPLHPSVAAAVAKGGMKAAWEATHRRRHGRGVPAAPPPATGFEELEALVAALPLPDPADAEALRAGVVRRREDFLRQLAAVGRLEAGAQATTSRELDAMGAVAALCGRRYRYALRRTAVVVGRFDFEKAGSDAYSGGGVDVNLLLEDREGAAAVSRHQAHVFMEADGSFKVRRLGRRAMSVNGRAVARGQVAALPHLSLLRAGRVALLWVVNRGAVDRLLRRSQAMTVC
jgi:microspherule protein 1